MKQPTSLKEKTALIKVLRRIADEMGTNSVSRAEFVRRSGIPEHQVQLLFGSYNGLVEAAGLVPRKFAGADVGHYSTEEILAEITRVLRIPDSKLTTIFFEQHSQMSFTPGLRRFGGWLNALNAAAHQLDPERERDLISRIRAYTARAALASRATPPTAEGTRPLPQTAADDDCKGPDTPIQGGILYGELIHFRGLEHAPVNELGVILLFGMICRELGYVVEMVKRGFPDCEAKRQVRPGIWQRVRIEFEFRARKFWKHGHNPEHCDLIVCWENDWPDCPIEVLELKSASQRLALSSKRE